MLSPSRARQVRERPREASSTRAVVRPLLSPADSPLADHRIGELTRVAGYSIPVVMRFHRAARGLAHGSAPIIVSEKRRNPTGDRWNVSRWDDNSSFAVADGRTHASRISGN